MDNNVSKHGDLLKCPGCGAYISEVSVKCPECGHEFHNIKANDTISFLLETLNNIDATSGNDENTRRERKVQTISNFPVPNTKADLIEMLNTAYSNSRDSRLDPAIRQAWKTKTDQIATKVEIMLKDDKDAQLLLGKMRSHSETKSKRNKVIAIVAAVVLVVVGCTIWFSSSSADATQTKHDTVLVQKKDAISKAVQSGLYDAAFDSIASLNNYIQIERLPLENYNSYVGDSYQKLVIALIREGDLEGAAMVGLDYREKLNNETEWFDSQIFKVLVQECEAQNVDDSPLR